MLLIKTIRAQVFSPTRRKMSALEDLWNSWKAALLLPRDYKFLRSNTNLPSYYCRDISWKVSIGEDAPVSLAKDALRLRPGNTFAPWFVSIITPSGRVWLPFRMARGHAKVLGETKLADSRLIKRGRAFYVLLVVEKEVPNPIIPTHGVVLAVDLGERVIAASVALADGSIRDPKFHGREVRGIRRHYAWLRRRLGKRRLARTMRRISDTEHRTVDDRLHKIAKSIVQLGTHLGASVIVLGELTGIKKRGRRSKRFNRMVNAMPFRRLTFLVEYKAAWEGIAVLRVREDYTSRECRLCHEWGRRPSQGRFVCAACGEYNADLNGAVGIGQRALAYMAIAGAPGSGPTKGGALFHDHSSRPVATGPA